MLRTRVAMFIVCFLFLLSSVVMAQTPVINAEQVKSWMEGKQKVLLIDTRTLEEYQQSHIPGAINIMPENIQSSSAKLPKDKKALIIFYCRGME
jgi:phage shock protein E